MIESGVSPQRIALGIEYDGSGFHGWQSQRSPRVPTLQDALENALSRIADQAIRVHCAGRTDTGVHATAQVVHFDTEAVRSERAWMLGCNSLLPPGIAVVWAKPVDPQFHARFSAIHRRYRYLILNRPVRAPLLASRVCVQRRELDAARMHEAAQYLLGERDFSAFRAAGCQSSTAMRRVERIDVSRHADMVAIDIQANAFLLHMVRNIVGSLMQVGMGEQAPDWMRELLESADRARAAATAPPDGLYLVEVGYEAHWAIPTPMACAWSLG